MKTTLFFLWAAALLTACGGTTSPAASAPEPEPLPAGAVAFDYDRHLFFDMLVGDSIPARLVFDTGADLLYLDSLWLRRAGYKPGQTVRTFMPAGAGTSGSYIPLLLDSLSFGTDSLRWVSTATPVVDLKSILGRRCDGIFGVKFLAGRCVEFNLRRGYMRAVSSDTLSAAGFARLPLERRGNGLLAPLCVHFDRDRVLDGMFLIDMGCADAVVVSSSAARKTRFEGYAARTVDYATPSGGVGGEAAGRLCRVDSVRFGGRSFAAVPVDVSRNETGFLAREDVDGLIGNRLLERFDFAIDFAQPALWLRLRPEAGEPFPCLSPGFRAIDRTDICPGWIVTGRYAGFAPEGIRSGDVVVGRDGGPLTDSLWKTPGRYRIGVLRDGALTEYAVETRELLE